MYNIVVISPARRLLACYHAIREKGHLDEIVVQGALAGFPRAGKSSFKDRLVGQFRKSQASTGVMEKVVKMKVSKSIVHGGGVVWREVDSIIDETVLVTEKIAVNIARMFQSTNCLKSEDPEGFKCVLYDCYYTANCTEYHDRLKLSLTKDLLTFSTSTSCTLNPYEVVESSLCSQDCSTASMPYAATLHHCNLWTQYMSDVGGQLELQELYSSLLVGPALFYHVFRADQDLNAKFHVEYLHSGGKSTIPYEASMTTKDTILQFLASVSSISLRKKPDGGGQQVKPKIFFIATHIDKLESYDKIKDVDKELQQIVKGTQAYRDGLVVYGSESCMLLPVNNLSKDDKNFQDVRVVVDRVVTHCDDYRIRTPYTWSLFAVTIQHYKEPVLLYDTCLAVGEECGIDSVEEMDNCLWFLQYQTGILRHYKDIPELQHLVIKDPQYIFDIVTNLIVGTFTFENLVGNISIQDEFVKKGIFSLESLRDLLSKHSLLSADQIIKLLEYHLIVAPLWDDGVLTRYFMPCALVHADLHSCPESAPHWVPSLLFTFSSGYCPKGLFGAMVAKLLHPSVGLTYEWEFKEDQIFRNQISFTVGPYLDRYRFTVTSTFIQVDVLPFMDCDRKVTLASVCCHVRRHMSKALYEVTSKINYDTIKAAQVLSFLCPNTSCHRVTHTAHIRMIESIPCVMECSITHRPVKLPVGHMMWFNEEVCAFFVNIS